jgi:hypothetical protein
MSSPIKTVIVPGRPGLKVRKPDGGHLDEDGEPVVWSTYWQRRKNDGDVAIKPTERAAARAATAKAKE